MGYLFHFRPGLKSIATFIDEVITPRVKGKDATAVEAIWRDLWNFTMARQAERNATRSARAGRPGSAAEPRTGCAR